MVRVDLKLGSLYSHYKIKEHVKAYTAYQRALGFLEQLSSHGDARTAARADVIRAMKALGHLCEEAFTPTEGAGWYLKAMEEHDSEAASSLASLYLDHPEVVAVLPEDTRQILVRVAGETKKDPATCPKLFAQEVARVWAKKRDERIAAEQSVASQYHDLAAAYQSQGRRDDYRKALSAQFDELGRQVRLSPTASQPKSDQAKVAAELARSYLDANKTELAVEWTTRAADLGGLDSLLQLADWYEKGTMVKADAQKADHYRYLSHRVRGWSFFGEHRYQDALPELKKGCEFQEANGGDHNRLAICYGRLGHWDDAIKAYRRSIELVPRIEDATGYLLNLLEALTCAERPNELLEFVQAIEKKGWKLPEIGSQVAKQNALFHGFRAIALLVSGKDASEAEIAMRQFSGQPGFQVTGWRWDELNNWLKTTKLAADRKAAVAKILGELQGTAGLSSTPGPG